MTFQPGHTLSPGRPQGSSNRRSEQLRIRLKDRGDVDPADYCSSIVSNPNEPTELKLQAANFLLPYLYPKRGAVATPRYVDIQIDVPEFERISDAESFLAKIATLVARNELDIQSGIELSGLVKLWIDSQYQREELAYKTSPPDQRDQTIRIEGGLPALPGTNITMPVINGHAVSEQLLTAPTDVVPPNEFTTDPAEAKAQGPHPLQKHHFEPSPEEPGTNSSPGMNSTNGPPPSGLDGQGDTSAPPESQDQGSA